VAQLSEFNTILNGVLAFTEITTEECARLQPGTIERWKCEGKLLALHQVIDYFWSLGGQIKDCCRSWPSHQSQCLIQGARRTRCVQCRNREAHRKNHTGQRRKNLRRFGYLGFVCRCGCLEWCGGRGMDRTSTRSIPVAAGGPRVKTIAKRLSYKSNMELTPPWRGAPAVGSWSAGSGTEACWAFGCGASGCCKPS